MIRLTQATTNGLIINKESSADFFLLRFVNRAGCDLERLVIKTDNEPSCPFLLFTVIEDTDVDLTPAHEWELYVYENINGVNLDHTLATLIHEENIFVTPEVTC